MKMLAILDVVDTEATKQVIPLLPQKRKLNPGWKKIDDFNRKRYADKAKKDLEDILGQRPDDDERLAA